MTAPAARALPAPAQEYLAQVTGHLRDLDPTLRGRLVVIAAENLAERPEAASFRDLAADLGGPRAYAQMLRDEAESAEPGAIEFSRWRRRRRRWFAGGTIMVLVAALIATALWWVSWQADIGSNELRVCADAAAPADEECSQVGVRDIDLADIVQVTCRGTISVTANLYADHDVTVTRAWLGHLEPRTGPDEYLGPGAMPGMLVDEVQVWQNTDPEWNPIRTSWPVTIGPSPTRTMVTFLVTTCPDSADPDPGMSQLIETIRVNYRALGRDRMIEIPLIDTVAITTR